MRFSKILFTLLAVTAAFTARAQSEVDLTVKNQHTNGDTLFFDIYIRTSTGPDIYLENSDFILDYDEANFTSPQFGFVDGSTYLLNSSGAVTTSYNYNIYTRFGEAFNAGKLMVLVALPAFSNQTEFDARIARIDNTASTYRIGTFYLTGMQNLSTNPDLNWITNQTEGGNTQVFSLNNSTWNGSSQALTTEDPTPITEPTLNASSLSFSNINSASMTLSLTSGNGARRLILAHAASSIGSNNPSDGLTYTASSVFGSGSQIGSSGVYAVYDGTGNSVTVTGLSSSTTYYFEVYEYNGSNGQTENYLTPGVETSQATPAPGVQVNVKIFLQGPYNVSTGTMDTSLNKNSYLPVNQPYTNAYWKHTATEYVANGFFTSHRDIVDWVIVELRSGTAATDTLQSKACFLKKDGTIVDIDGTSKPLFTRVTTPGDYYIVIKHRIHLSVMSAAKVTLGSSSSLYDFTTGTGKFYKNQAATLTTGVYGMYTGETNVSGIVTLADYQLVTTQRNTAGYKDGDINMSGIVTLADYAFITSNRNKGTQVP